MASPIRYSRTPVMPVVSGSIALFLLGVAVVLLVSSVTWFGTGQRGVGIGQVVLGLVLAGVGGSL